MIKTAGLSSPGPVVVEPDKVLAWLKSAIVGLQSVTSGIDRGLQTQTMEMELQLSSFD